MKIKEAREKLGIRNSTIEEYYVDAAQIVGNEEFERHDSTDYRDRTIKRLNKAKVSYKSNANIIHNLMVDYVKVSCPECGKNMKVTGGGGGSDTMSTNYYCEKCGNTVVLTLPHDGFGVRFKGD